MLTHLLWGNGALLHELRWHFYLGDQGFSNMVSSSHPGASRMERIVSGKPWKELMTGPRTPLGWEVQELRP